MREAVFVEMRHQGFQIMPGEPEIVKARINGQSRILAKTFLQTLAHHRGLPCAPSPFDANQSVAPVDLVHKMPMEVRAFLADLPIRSLNQLINIFSCDFHAHFSNSICYLSAVFSE